MKSDSSPSVVILSRTLDYPSYADAAASRIELITHRYGANWSREAFMPAPANPSAAFRARMLFHCDGDAP